MTVGDDGPERLGHQAASPEFGVQFVSDLADLHFRSKWLNLIAPINPFDAPSSMIQAQPLRSAWSFDIRRSARSP
jgi:hypothetical protein